MRHKCLSLGFPFFSHLLFDSCDFLLYILYECCWREPESESPNRQTQLLSDVEQEFTAVCSFIIPDCFISFRIHRVSFWNMYFSDRSGLSWFLYVFPFLPKNKKNTNLKTGTTLTKIPRASTWQPTVSHLRNVPSTSVVVPPNWHPLPPRHSFHTVIQLMGPRCWYEPRWHMKARGDESTWEAF